MIRVIRHRGPDSRATWMPTSLYSFTLDGVEYDKVPARRALEVLEGADLDQMETIIEIDDSPLLGPKKHPWEDGAWITEEIELSSFLDMLEEDGE